MRQFYLFFSLLCILALAACGTEEELTPPAFSNVMVNGATVMSIPFKDPNVTITGNIDDFSATIVANSTVTGEVPVVVNNDGSWSFQFTANEGVNIVSLTASDVRGNINQLVLTVLHDTTAPLVTAVVQSVDPLDPNVSQLVVTFNEALLEASLATALFAVDGSAITAAPFDPLTPQTVILPLGAALTTGDYILTYDGVTDIATPTGNSTDSTPTYAFPFTIQ
jgi:hypothetical protein